jgi:hypothetical protein
MKVLRSRAVRLVWALVLVVVASAPALAQHAAAAAPPTAGPLRPVWYALSAPPQVRSPVTFSPTLVDAGADRGSKLGATVLLLGVGIGMTVGGRELEPSIGFPGAVIRYTGIGMTALGLLSFCGCL